MAAANFRITGHKDLERNLARLDMHLQKKLLRKALRVPAKAIVKDARALVPRDTGLLRASLGTRIIVQHRNNAAYAVIGPRKGYKNTRIEGLKGAKSKRIATHYAHLVEFGTKPHRQRFIPIAGGVIQLGGDMHPGTEPKPFLRPAFEKNETTAVSVMASVIRQGIESDIKFDF